jgi:hypothetical protein
MRLAFGWHAWLGSGLLITSSLLIWVVRGSSHMLRIAFALLAGTAFSWELLRIQVRSHPGWNFLPGDRASVILARPPQHDSSPVRVVFQTPLEPATPSLPEPRSMLTEMGWLFAALLLRAKGFPGWLFLAVVAWCLSSIWFKVIRSLRRSLAGTRLAANSSAAERSGPAFLLELARCWPRSRSARMETIFVVAGGTRAGHAGLREISRRISSDWQRKPTLVVNFQGPGVGKELVICASRDLHFAEDAAKDLWIPHRSLNRTPFSGYPSSPPQRERDTLCLTLIGSGCFGTEEFRLDADTLERTEQLATELALRWSRRTVQGEDLRSERSR